MEAFVKVSFIKASVHPSVKVTKDSMKVTSMEAFVKVTSIEAFVEFTPTEAFVEALVGVTFMKAYVKLRRLPLKYVKVLPWKLPCKLS